LWGKNNRVSLALMQRKLTDAGAAGARMLINACTYCQIQFDSVRREHLDPRQKFNDLPAVLVSQLLGFSFGLPLRTLGLTSDWKQIHL
jgi:heterodisulfide reductase subunit B